MENSEILRTRYGRDFERRAEIQARIEAIDKEIADLALGRSRLVECVGQLTVRMDGVLDEIFEEQSQTVVNELAPAAEVVVLVAA